MPAKVGIDRSLEISFKLIQKNDLEKLSAFLIAQASSTQASLVASKAKANGDYLVTVAARHGRLEIMKCLKDEFNAWYATI